MDKTKLQNRQHFIPTGLKLREAEGEQESRTIEGCAIVFNRETVLWDGKYEKVREVIAPSCITEEFLREQDIKLNLLHNRNDSLARCNNKGANSLKLELREDGLYFTAEMPKCDIGDRALELIKNGTYSGCSFEFRAKDFTEKVDKTDDGREDYLYTHTAFESVSALTIAMDPAYEDTTVGVCKQREKELDAEAQAKHQREEAEKKTRARELSALQDEVLDDALIAQRENI